MELPFALLAVGVFLLTVNPSLAHSSPKKCQPKNHDKQKDNSKPDKEFPFERLCGGGAPQITCNKWAEKQGCKKPVCRPGKNNNHYCHCLDFESITCEVQSDCWKISKNCLCKKKKCANCQTPPKAEDTLYDDNFPKDRKCGKDTPHGGDCSRWKSLESGAEKCVYARCLPRPSDEKEFCYCKGDTNIKCPSGNNTECAKVGRCICTGFTGENFCSNCELLAEEGNFPDERKCKEDDDCNKWKDKNGIKCKKAVCLDGPEGPKEKNRFCYCVGKTDYFCQLPNDCWAVGRCKCKPDNGISTCAECTA